jgi:hypothetical protein
MRLLLEGPDLQTLLEQVRTEYGPKARIVQAEKVRRGGVGGFFARERFNIQVEVSGLEAPSLPVVRRSGNAVKSVMDLVDRLNQEEEALYQDVRDEPSAPPAPTAPAAPTAPSVPTASAVASAYAAAPPAPAHLESPPLVNRPPHASATPVSTQSATFTDVMSRLQHSIDPPALAPSPADAPGGTDTREREPALRSTVPAHPTPEPAPPLRRAGDGGSLETGAKMAARATRMGVPTHVLAGIKDPADVYRRLLGWVESRPTAPMFASTPGQVIVVVGEIKAAMGVASALARHIGVDPAAIHLAVPASSTGYDVPVGRLLSDVSDMAMRRQRWQHSVGSTIVVVEAALPPAARGWLAAVVSALAPTFTWAVAQASTKVNDVATWAAAVGDVDALALVNVSATGDPAAALAGALPIGLLDGQRATVTRWMAMLTEESERR